MRPPKITIGWREWLRLPDLGVKLVKAKVDTGARTSSLHAEDVELFTRGGHRMVRFTIHPKQRSSRGAVTATARLLEERRVRSSNGHQEVRPVIETTVDVGDVTWPIELTLTSRDVMGFRMLLGRQAMRGHVVVDPARSYVTRKVKTRKRSS